MPGRVLVTCGFAFLVLALGSTVARAQDSGVDLDRMFAVTFTDALHATVVGADSRVLQTADGGATWTERHRAPGARLAAVAFATPEVGVAVGEAPVTIGPGQTTTRGVMLRTTDGGVTWSTVPVPDGLRALTSVAFSDALLGAAVGEACMLRTTDGGATWTQSSVASGDVLSAVAFDGRHGYAVGRGVVLETTDAGARWKRKEEPGCQLTAVVFTGGKNVVMAGSGLLWMSADGGKKWRTLRGELNYLAQKAEWEGLASQATSARITAFSGLAAPAPGAMVAVGQTGVIARTTDGGRIWNLADTRMTYGFTDVAFGDPLHGIAVGLKTVVTMDGGRTWKGASGSTELIAADALSGTWDVTINGLKSDGVMKCTLAGNTTMSFLQNDLAVSGVLGGWSFDCSGRYTLAGTERQSSLRGTLLPAPFSGKTDRLRVVRFTVESKDYTAVFDGDLTSARTMSGQLRMTAYSADLGTVRLTASWSATRR